MATNTSAILGRTFEIVNPSGLHAVPIGLLGKTAKSLNCEIFVRTNAFAGARNKKLRKVLCVKPLAEDQDWCPASFGILFHLGYRRKGSSILLGVRGARANECLDRFQQLFAVEFLKIDDSRRQGRIDYYAEGAPVL